MISSHDYEWKEVKLGFTVTQDDIPMQVSRWVWFWQRNRFERMGWTFAGQFFLSVLLTRPLRLEDYIWGDKFNALPGLSIYADGSNA